MVFVCSPNNPTGNAQPVDAVASLAGRTDALVIVDEAYIEFGGATCLPLVADHPNVVVTRTMSKAFALAGARIGYALGSPDVIGDLQRVRLPYHLSAITQAAGVAALRHAKEAMAILDAIRDERDRILGRAPRDAGRHGLSRPTRTSSCSCRRSPPPRCGKVWWTAACSSATSRPSFRTRSA